MRFGIREVANVKFTAISPPHTEYTFKTLKISTMEQTTDRVHAVGGQGAMRLIGWSSGKKIRYNIQDALITPETLGMLTGSPVDTDNANPVVLPKKEVLVTDSNGKVDLKHIPSTSNNTVHYCKTNFGYDIIPGTMERITGATAVEIDTVHNDSKIIVDYYYDNDEQHQFQIFANKFAGYYSIEADGLWRKEETGGDVAATFAFPKVKIVGDFTLTGEMDGEPSVFDFNVEAYPNYDNEIVIITIGKDEV